MVWKELNITNSFTLEASFCGPDFGPYADLHFNTDMLQEIGHRYCQALLDYCDPEQLKVKAALDEIEMLLSDTTAAPQAEQPKSED